MIKVLFIPHPMPSHIIPLVALAKMLNKNSFEVAFLLPKEFHQYVRRLSFEVLEIDRKIEDRTTPEMIAFGKFKPQIVVDDLSYTTAFSTRFANIPRVCIVRKGILPHETNTTGYKHSSEVIRFLETINKLNLPSYGIWQPKNIADLFIGDVNIIPSIPSIEELPLPIKNDASYIYCGPLLLSDKEVMENAGSVKISGDTRKYYDSRPDTERFIERHKDLKLVYFTHGLTNPSDIINKAHSCINFLLNQGAAVITNLQELPDLNAEQHDRVFTANLLPMQLICSHAHLMIHHCGSGTYNYQLTHKVPAIILGSKFFDRDETGIQLDSLGAALFVSADLNEESWHTRFQDGVRQLLDQSSPQYSKQKDAMAKLKLETIATSNNFNFENVLTHLQQRTKQNA